MKLGKKGEPLASCCSIQCESSEQKILICYGIRGDEVILFARCYFWFATVFMAMKWVHPIMMQLNLASFYLGNLFYLYMLEHWLFLVHLLVLFILQVAWQTVQDSLPSSNLNSQDDSIRGQRSQGSQEIGQASTTRANHLDNYCRSSPPSRTKM